jgi:hypothetical protein
MIAKYAVRYIVESSSFTDWSTRTKWLSANITHCGLPSGPNTNNTALQLELYLALIRGRGGGRGTRYHFHFS